MRHLPVMVDEVVRYLVHERTRVVMDGTVGFGGHAEAILRECPGVRLIGVDRDATALEAAASRLSAYADRVSLVRGLYSDFDHVLAGVGKVDGVLLDLGVSSPQLDDPARGFGHSANGPLDMRMGREGETAAELLARLDADQIASLLRELGEVRQPRRVARAIRAAVDAGTLSTTSELRAAVVAALGRGVAPAELSRVFQAVRIAVNRELDILRAVPRRRARCAHSGRALGRHELSLARGSYGEAVPARPECRVRVPAERSHMRVRSHAAHRRVDAQGRAGVGQ